jgi:hypothetical protein
MIGWLVNVLTMGIDEGFVIDDVKKNILECVG